MADYKSILLFPIPTNSYSAEDITQLKIKLEQPEVQKINATVTIFNHSHSRTPDAVVTKPVHIFKVNYSADNNKQNSDVIYNPNTGILLCNIPYPTIKFIKGNLYSVKIEGTIEFVTDSENDIVESQLIKNFENTNLNPSINLNTGSSFTIFCDKDCTKIPNLDKIFWNDYNSLLKETIIVGKTDENGEPVVDENGSQIMEEQEVDVSTGGPGGIPGPYGNIGEGYYPSFLTKYTEALDQLPSCVDFTENKQPTGDEGKDLGYSTSIVDGKTIINIPANYNPQIIKIKGTYIFIDVSKLPNIKEDTIYNLTLGSNSLKSDLNISIENNNLEFSIPMEFMNSLEEDSEEDTETEES